MRKNEFSRIDIKFLGRFFHPNGKDVRRFYPVTDYSGFIESEIQSLEDFKETLIDLSGTSSKYQMVGIHKGTQLGYPTSLQDIQSRFNEISRL